MKVTGRQIGLLKQLKVFSISINPLKGKMIINKIKKNNGCLTTDTVFSMYADQYKSDYYDEWTEVTGIDKPYFMENEIISAIEESINHVYGFRPTVLSQIKREYQDREKHLGYCHQCPRYDRIWSCPPLSIDVEEFLGKYSWMYLVCSKINLDGGLIQATAGAENINDIGWEIMSTVKLDMDDKLRQLETAFPGSIALSATA